MTSKFPIGNVIFFLINYLRTYSQFFKGMANGDPWEAEV